MTIKNTKKKDWTPPSGRKRPYKQSFFEREGPGSTSMGRHCEICGTGEQGCDDARVHLDRTEAGKRVVQETLYGRWAEESRVDVEQGREARKCKYASVMEAGAEREAAWAAGAGYAQKQGAAREAKIMGTRCDICRTERNQCERPEVHFSGKDVWIEHCNEVLWVMHQAEWKADDAAGRERKVWHVGDRMAEGEGKEHAVEEGLEWAKRHAAAYEAQVLDAWMLDVLDMSDMC